MSTCALPAPLLQKLTSYYTASMNLGSDSELMKSPPSENSIAVRHLWSGISSDHSSPNLSRSVVNYHYNNLTGESFSGESSAGSNKTPSPLQNLQVSPVVNAEDDVLVMDDVLVDSRVKGGGESGGIGGGKYSRSSSSSSGGGTTLYKTDLCKTWDETGSCRYGYKCQVAHGQQEMRGMPKHLRNRNQLEMSRLSSSLLSSPLGPRSMISLETPLTSPSSASSISDLSEASPILSKKCPAVSYQIANLNWSPVDDNITVQLPGSTVLPLSREAVNENIHNILYGPTHRKRLSAFRCICPDFE